MSGPPGRGRLVRMAAWLVSWWLLDGRGLAVDLALLAAGVLLASIALGFVGGVSAPFLRPLLLGGWILGVLGILRASSRLPAPGRRSADVRIDTLAA